MTQLKDIILSAFLGALIAFGIAIAVGNPLQHGISASAQSSSMNMGNDQAMGTNGTMTSSNTMPGNQQSTIVRDSQTILLEGKSIPAKSYIHLYDSTPFMIMNGHIAAKLPCNSASNATVQVLIGSAPDLKPANFELVKELSTPGRLCLYHVDLMSNPTSTAGSSENATGIITDIAISNPSSSSITFPATSTVVIGVNEIMPRAEEGAHSH